MMAQTILRPRRANTILYCSNWAATVAFYRETLGLTVEFANTWFVEFRVNDGAYLSVAEASRASIAAVAGQGITLAWQLDDLAACHRSLAAAGITVTPIRRRWGAWVFYCHDPEGHRLEFWAATMNACLERE